MPMERFLWLLNNQIQTKRVPYTVSINLNANNQWCMKTNTLIVERITFSNSYSNNQH